MQFIAKQPTKNLEQLYDILGENIKFINYEYNQNKLSIDEYIREMSIVFVHDVNGPEEKMGYDCVYVPHSFML
jgi:hypothetical protein